MDFLLLVLLSDLGRWLFLAAQGGVVFLTARHLLCALNIPRWPGKIAAVVISYIAWTAFTITAYTLGGGENGMMDGGLFVLMLCFSAMISSLLYLLIWLFIPSANTPDPEDWIMIEPRV